MKKRTVSSKMFSLAKTPLGCLVTGVVFGKFSKLLPLGRIKENEKVIAFWHPKPSYEKHILIVPKKVIKNVSSLRDKDWKYIEEIFVVVKKIIKDLGWEKKGYSLLVNGGRKQEIKQLHFHLINGAKL